MALVKTVRLNIITDPGDSKLKLDAIDRKAQELGRLNPEVKVQVDTMASQLKLAVLKQELRSIGTGPVPGGPGGLIGGLIGSAGSAGGAGASGLSGLASLGPLGAAGLAAVGAAAAVAALALAPVAAAIIPITLGFGTLAAFAGPEVVKVFKAMTAQGTALKTAMKNLSPAEKDLLQQLQPLRDAFGALRKSVQPEIMTAFGEAIKIVKDIFPALKPLVEAAGKALDKFLRNLVDWLESPQGQSFINWLKTVGPKDIANFGRVIWDVAKGVGQALNQIYRAGSWIDKFLTHWHDDWVLVKTEAQIQWDQIKIAALKVVDFIIGAFSHLPGPLGAPFRAAQVSIHNELGKIQNDILRATGEFQNALDRIHGEKVPIQFTAAFVASHGVPVAPAAKGMRVPGFGGGDRFPALLEGGEAVVPKHLTPQVAPFLKAHGVPGFAQGGLAGGWDINDFFNPAVAATVRRIGAGATRFENRGIAYVKAHPLTYWKFGFPGGPGSGALGGDPAANMAIAKQMFPWGADQWSPFVSLEMSEAGFNRFALNPSSGAYGIPQALPPTKMPFAAQAAGGSHAGPQLGWMYSYIAGRYGDPASAWSWHLAHNWYDSGGWLPPGTSIATNNTGRPERVGGGDLIINNLYLTTPDAATTVRQLQQYAERNGGIRLRIRTS